MVVIVHPFSFRAATRIATRCLRAVFKLGFQPRLGSFDLNFAVRFGFGLRESAMCGGFSGDQSTG
ncbi:MAG: hypothetical protein V4793_36235 [Paraburkholderia tropica]|uniref:hypothetical protein n=1 Tax=Paraburkholderia tropica TaxID=92647 RepID=UPI000A9AF95C|nr:hypothetical protein [Paraburkholderia tropica]QNB15558.1 hypothetical protein G5S35_28640 [Paraburkholderia tropica]RQN38247.1 hypothetical protein EHZ25_15205 [Paraburkholderia tropica]